MTKFEKAKVLLADHISNNIKSLSMEDYEKIVHGSLCEIDPELWLGSEDELPSECFPCRMCPDFERSSCAGQRCIQRMEEFFED